MTSPLYDPITNTVNEPALRALIQKGDFENIPDYVSTRWLNDLCTTIAKTPQGQSFPFPDDLVRDAFALGRSGQRALVTEGELKKRKERLLGTPTKKEKARATALSLLDE